MKTLVLGLGNELLSDDGVGILAARALKEKLSEPKTLRRGEASEQIHVVESSLAGLALLEIFIGYERAIVIDAVQTGLHPPGTIYELSPADLDSVVAPSPHYAGLPELLALAEQLHLDFPKEIKIFALEVADAYTIGGGLSAPVKQALTKLIQRVQAQVRYWQEEALYPPPTPSRGGE